MVALRISNVLRTASAAARYRAPATAPSYRTFTTTPRAFAGQGYGDGKGSPEGEKPSEQPEANKTQENSEHPGPAPPDVGKGTGGGPTKAAFSESMNKAASQKDPADASAESGGARSKEAKETGSSPTGGSIGEGKGGEALKGPQGDGAPQPKIHNQSVSGQNQELSKEQKREVDEHNKEFEKRHDRAAPASDDKVDQKFWKGDGGVQK
ncbi:hypothetical protein AB5N19_13771 [Seiridium cardinale]|uniref:Uncharacterized protein n=1 Tax=Seiridium cardinale TaxID=138064 RepID=A0ABR2XKP6_9PEZI